MSLTDDFLIALDAHADNLQTSTDALSDPSFVADGKVDKEKLEEAAEYLRLAKQLLQEAQDALDEDPIDEAKVARLKKIARDLLKKAADLINEAIK